MSINQQTKRLANDEQWISKLLRKPRNEPTSLPNPSELFFKAERGVKTSPAIGGAVADECWRALTSAACRKLQGQRSSKSAVRFELLRAFRAKLRKCGNVWEVAALLGEYAKELGLLNVRYHRVDHSSKMLVFTACAGMPIAVEQQVRAGKIAKRCDFLTLRDWDSLWPFKNERPTLFRLEAEAPLTLESAPGPGRIPTVQVPHEQCSVLKLEKGRQWICFPFRIARRKGRPNTQHRSSKQELSPWQITASWDGKVSCDVDPAALDRNDFRSNVMTFWMLAQEAGRDLELYALKETVVETETPEVIAASSDEDSPDIHASSRSRTKPREILEAVAQYEATHGEVEYAALAAVIAPGLRDAYVGELIGIDGGETNVAIVKAILHDIRSSKDPSVGRIVTNNVGVLSMIPAGGNFPAVEGIGGKVRCRNGKPGALIGDLAAVKQIRSKLFAVSLIAASGIQGSSLLTASGDEDKIKQAFMKVSTDIIVPVPSYKWACSSGSKFFDLCTGLNGDRSLMFVTVIPHADATQPERIRHILDTSIYSRFFEGMRVISKFENAMGYSVVKVEFDPGLPMICPKIRNISVGQEEIANLAALRDKHNPQDRADIRLIVCVQLGASQAARKQRRADVARRRAPRSP
jgi:DeoR/GlpR family transcriptional regulator of sugar metabolism